jgi:hypothetical protein
MAADRLEKVLDKSWESKPLKEIIAQSPEILEGLGPVKAKQVMEALGCKTIEEFANNKFVVWAQALVALSRTEA